MGKAPSKQKRVKLSSKLPHKVQCPLCDEDFTTNSTYNQLNQHLFRCGNILHKSKLFTGQTTTGINDEFQLVIDYNSTTQKQEEEKRVHTTPLDFNTKYNELKSFIKVKTEQMAQHYEVSADSIEGVLEKIKNINIYDDISITIGENEKLTLAQFLNKFFDDMIEKNIFSVINGKTLAFDFNKKIDWELLGILIVALLIHSDITIKYKFNTLLCKMLQKQRVILNDIQYIDITLYEQLNKLTHEDDIDSQNIYYTANEDELVIGGKTLKVNENNLLDYIDKRVNYEAMKYKEKIVLIRKGIYGFIPEKDIMIFTGDEFYQIINRMA